MKQLDLFDQPVRVEPVRKSGEVAQFPTRRRADVMREAIRMLMSKSKPAGRTWWSKHIRDLRRERAAQGFPSEAIKADLDAYAAAVAHEMNLRITYRMGPDHAA